MLGRPQELGLAYLPVLREVHEAEEVLHLVRYLHLPLVVVLHLMKSQQVEGLKRTGPGWMDGWSNRLRDPASWAVSRNLEPTFLGRPLYCFSLLSSDHFLESRSEV